MELEKEPFEMRKVPLVDTKRRSRREKNVLKNMKDQCGARGPLSVLYKCVENRLRAKVWTRGSCHIRGICRGFIIAFDKHWNLAMVDVDEIYLNPLYSQSQLDQVGPNSKLGSLKTELPPNNPPDSNIKDDIFPITNDFSSFDTRGKDNKSSKQIENDKYLIRHVPQMLLRGDNVVIVAINDY